MKQNLKNLVIFAAAAGLSLALPGSLHAQAVEKVNITAAALSQGATTTNKSGTTITTAAPLKNSVTTANLLAELSKDESSFPALAKLGFNGTAFVLYNASVTNLVSSMTLTPSSAPITAGVTTTNGAGIPPYTQTLYQTATVAYSGSVSGLSFTVNGIATTGVKAGAPATKPASKAGNFTDAGTFSFANGTGAGVDSDGSPILINNFTISASGSATENTNSLSGP